MILAMLQGFFNKRESRKEASPHAITPFGTPMVLRGGEEPTVTPWALMKRPVGTPLVLRGIKNPRLLRGL